MRLRRASAFLVHAGILVTSRCIGFVIAIGTASHLQAAHDQEGDDQEDPKLATEIERRKLHGIHVLAPVESICLLVLFEKLFASQPKHTTVGRLCIWAESTNFCNTFGAKKNPLRW